MRKLSVFFTLLLVFACSKTPPTAAPSDEVKAPIDTLYVGVPRMIVYAQPIDSAPVVTTYG